MSVRESPAKAVLDANALAGGLTRNLLLTLAEEGLFRPLYSATILDEVERYVATRTDAATARRQRNNIEGAFPEAIVVGYQRLAERLVLPDVKDGHVLACAIKGAARTIVTDNLKDFPAEVLGDFGIEAMATDAFIARQIELGGRVAFSAIRRMRDRFRKPEIDELRLVELVRHRGLPRTASLLERNTNFLT